MLVRMPNVCTGAKREGQVSPTACCGSLKRRSEEVTCVVCRVRFCCAPDREAHENGKHSAEALSQARHHLQMLKETKPLVCTVCCQTFLSGLFVNDTCKKPNQSSGNFKEATRIAHTLICIPEWAVRKYLLPVTRKRSWQKANDAPEVDILIQPATEAVQENSFSDQKNLQGILSKHRKSDLSDKPSRRVTFSPVTVVAFTHRFSTCAAKVISGRVDEPLSNLTPKKTVQPIIAREILSQAPALPGSASTILSPGEVEPGCDVFSPPLPNDVSAELYPQMSSTPYGDNEERRDGSQNYSSSPTLKFEQGEPTPSAGIFSSLANTICCVLQALPSAVAHLFSLGTHKENDGRNGKLVRRQRRKRSFSFTPYTHVPYRARRQVRQNARGDTEPLCRAIELLTSSPLEPS